VQRGSSYKGSVNCSRKQSICKNFYWYFSNNLIVPVVPTSSNARKVVRALTGHITTLSEDYLNAVDDIGQYHFPKQVQSVTFRGTNIIHGFLSGIPAWNGLTRKPKYQALHKGSGCLQVFSDVLEGVLHVVRTHC